jgi:Putative addiction module component
MKLTIHIKENKAAFFLELLQNFKDFITIEKVQEGESEPLSKEHQAILDARLKSYRDNPDGLLDWEEVHRELAQMQ